MKYVVLSVVVLLVLISFVAFYRVHLLMRENEVLREEQSLREQEYRQEMNVNKSLRYAKHDVEKYRRILAFLPQKENVIYAVVEDAKHRCNNANISFEYTIDLDGIPAWLKEDTVNTIQLLGNLLENAIEAQERLDEKWIRLSMQYDATQNQYIIMVENAKLQSENILENQMQTTKTNKVEHGYGTKIIDDVVFKYKGKVERKEGTAFFSCYCKFDII